MVARSRFTVVFLMLLGGAICAGSAKQARYDGVWWRAVDQYRHLGFLDGYIDCDAYIHPGPARFVGVSTYEYEKMVDSYFATHPKEHSRPVTAVLLSVAPPNKAIIAKSTFGIEDGETWRQGGPSYRLGFIEGYFACLRSAEKQPARFTKPDTYYVEQISNWYGVKDLDPGAINLKRSPTKIARVLFMFKDTHNEATPRSKAP